MRNKKENVLRLYNKYQKLFGAPLWKKNIMEAQVCDGYGYTLQITYKDGRKRVIEGDIGCLLYTSPSPRDTR